MFLLHYSSLILEMLLPICFFFFPLCVCVCVIAYIFCKYFYFAKYCKSVYMPKQHFFFFHLLNVERYNNGNNNTSDRNKN